MTAVDELESSIRDALRRRAEEIPDAVPPLSSGRSAAAPRRAPSVKWVAAAAAAVLLAAVLVGQQVERESRPRLRATDASPSTTTAAAPLPHVPQEVRATTDTVVFRASWGSTPGPIAVASDERHVFVADNDNRRVVRVDVASGNVDRTYPLGLEVQEMAVDPETGDLYTGTHEGVVDAISPEGATRRVFTAANPDEYPNLIQVTSPRDKAGVYGASYASRGLFRLADPRTTLPGWPVDDAYLGIGVVDNTIAAQKIDSGGKPVASVRLLSEPDWKPGFPEAFTAAGGRFRVLVTAKSEQGERGRSRLFDVDGTPAITAVYDVPAYSTRSVRISAGAVWMLVTTSSGAELHKISIL